MNTTTEYKIPAKLNKTIFRAYDIRGVVETELNEDVLYAVGLAIGSEAKSRGQSQIVVARDGRLTGQAYKQAMLAGLLATGMDVIDIGQVATPVLYFACFNTSATSGVVITGSHNPANYNGIKIVLDKKTLSTDAIQALYRRISENDIQYADSGKVTYLDIVPEYTGYICDHVQLNKKLKIVIDCGNGVAGNMAGNLFEGLGCEVTELFCEVDGRFPNHHPDPTVEENLRDIQAKVLEVGADCGLAFDGDADRLGVVTNAGQIVWADRQLMLYAKDYLQRNEGKDVSRKIIFDVKCSSLLPKVIEQYGGEPMMWKTGHSIQKQKMLDENAAFAGELSGHVFFREGWFDFDDGLYVGARLLEILSRTDKTCDEIFNEFPDMISTPELKLYIDEDQKHDFVERLKEKADFGDAELIVIDGVRVEYKEGWALVRASNTTPCLTMRFEADTEENLKAIQDKIGREILKLDQTLELPY